MGRHSVSGYEAGSRTGDVGSNRGAGPTTPIGARGARELTTSPPPDGADADDRDPLDGALPEQTDEDALEQAWENSDVEGG
jgi:hypothetical protein